MKSLLDALQEGRLIEFPNNDKEKCLEYLAILIEAIPDIGTGEDIVSEVKDREKQTATALGKGVACPHVRTHKDGELLCAVGWAPQGIEYGAPDGKKVHLVIMYYIPDSRRNVYLKEISGLAKALLETDGIEAISSLQDIHSVRDKLLDWVEIASNQAIPDAKARMIKLEARQAKAEEISPPSKGRLQIIPFTVVMIEQLKGVILSRDPVIMEKIESLPDIYTKFAVGAEFDAGEFQISVLSAENFSRNRILYQCVAVK